MGRAQVPPVGTAAMAAETLSRATSFSVQPVCSTRASARPSVSSATHQRASAHPPPARPPGLRSRPAVPHPNEVRCNTFLSRTTSTDQSVFIGRTSHITRARAPTGTDEAPWLFPPAQPGGCRDASAQSKRTQQPSATFSSCPLVLIPQQGRKGLSQGFPFLSQPANSQSAFLPQHRCPPALHPATRTSGRQLRADTGQPGGRRQAMNQVNYCSYALSVFENGENCSSK